MSMSKTILWGKDCCFTPDDMVVVKYDDYDNYEQAISNNKLRDPLKLILLSPNVEDNDVPVLLYFIALRNGSSIERVDFNRSAQTEAMSFLIVWEALVDALNQARYYQANIFLQEAKRYSIRLLTKLRSLLSLLEGYLRNVIAPIVEHSPYHHSQRTPDWYKLNPTLLDDLTRLKANLSAQAIGKTRIANIIAEHTTSLAEVLSRLSTANISMKHIIISSYFYALSIYHHRNERYGIAFLLAHRALDCAFCAMGLENKILREYGPKIGYVNDPTMKVYMMGIANELIANSVITPDQSRQKAIQSINETRNSLMYTHGVFGISQTEAGDALSVVKKIIRNVDDDNGRWSSYCQKLEFPQSFEYDYLFDAGESIDTYITTY